MNLAAGSMLVQAEDDTMALEAVCTMDQVEAFTQVPAVACTTARAEACMGVQVAACIPAQVAESTRVHHLPMAIRGHGDLVSPVS
jgi:hypothetical protein